MTFSDRGYERFQYLKQLFTEYAVVNGIPVSNPAIRSVHMNEWLKAKYRCNGFSIVYNPRVEFVEDPLTPYEDTSTIYRYEFDNEEDMTAFILAS